MPTSPNPALALDADARELALLARTWAATTLIGLYLVREGCFIWVNEQFCRDTGYAVAHLVGRRAESLVHPDDRTGMRAHARAMLQGQRTAPYEYRYVTATGETRWALETVVGVTFQGARVVLGNFVDITARKQLEAQLHHQAFHDALTGLPNRALVLDRLERALGHRARGDGEVAVLYLDLDGFKAINDAYGHHAGDAVLRQLAQRLRQVVRQTDTLGRLGGDEFAVVLDGMTARSDALRLADRIAAILTSPFIVSGHAVSLTASCGIAVEGTTRTTAEALLQDADIALYEAKSRGRACAVLAAPQAVA
jgi:diguanylate cyclase (GGDEF)-like protein/PAS domain S-box-containing protein